MAQSLLITLREGLEAALIVGIVLAYLARTGNRAYFGPIWLGTGAAVVLSILAGSVVFLTTGELKGRTEEIFEGSAMFLAVGVLSYMVVWMKRQAVAFRVHLQAQLEAALRAGSASALTLLAFVAVGREGLETVLFMFAAARTSTPLESFLGGALGLLIAVALGYAGYRGSRLLNLQTFFNVTGFLLIIFAAGLLARGIHEFQEAGLLPFVVEEVWNINPILNEKEGLGSFLKALFGYNGNPSLLEVIFYPSYLLVTLWYFLSARRLPKVA